MGWLAVLGMMMESDQLGELLADFASIKKDIERLQEQCNAVPDLATSSQVIRVTIEQVNQVLLEKIHSTDRLLATISDEFHRSMQNFRGETKADTHHMMEQIRSYSTDLGTVFTQINALRKIVPKIHDELKAVRQQCLQKEVLIDAAFERMQLSLGDEDERVTKLENRIDEVFEVLAQFLKKDFSDLKARVDTLCGRTEGHKDTIATLRNLVAILLALGGAAALLYEKFEAILQTLGIRP